MGGGHSNKIKAFTLIELLAIIVILAIIAVITVPIILNVIDNAKRGSIQDSAYGYKDAIQKYYVQQLSTNPDFKLNGEYEISNGNLGEYEIPISGTKPTSGLLKYNNNILVSGCLAFDDYKVDIVYGEVKTVVKGECTPIESGIVAYKVDGVNYYEASYVKANPVYYNPVSGNICTEEDYNNNTDKLGNTGCLMWYKYSGSNGKVNMILDHNTTSNVEWYTSDDNSYGPVTALTQLRTDTAGWTGVPVRIDSYTASWNNGTEDKTFTISYNGDRARLITAQEIANITGAYQLAAAIGSGEGVLGVGFDEHISPWNKYFYFGSLSSEDYDEQTEEQKARQQSYSWLFDNLSDCTSCGCSVADTNNSSNYGYWTSSPNAGRSDSAWSVYSDGDIDGNYVSDAGFGARPVITVSNSILSGS